MTKTLAILGILLLVGNIAIEGIVSRHDHLRKNVKHIEFGSYSSGRGSDGFHHRMSLKLSVDTSSLWDNPRMYVWKFLAQQEWKLGDGCLVTFNRIHVKQN